MLNIRQHPIFKNYGYSIVDHKIYNIPPLRIVNQRQHDSGYAMNMVSEGSNHKAYMSHRFIWECCNDTIPKGYEIDHINKNKLDNRIDNLRCVTISENRKFRDHTNIIKFARIAHTLKRFIKAINTETGEEMCFKCKSQCAKYFNISPALIYLIVSNKNRAKTANTNKGKTTFEYVEEKDVKNLIEIPHGRIGKNYKK